MRGARPRGIGREPSFWNGFQVPTFFSRNLFAGVDFHDSPSNEPSSDEIANWPRLLHASAAGPKSSSVESSSWPSL